MTSHYSLNPLSLQFKLQSPVLAGACSSSIPCQSGQSDLPIRSPPFSSTDIAYPTTAILSASPSQLSVSPLHGYVIATPSAARQGHSLSFSETPRSSDLGNLATTADPTSTFLLPESLGIGNMEGCSIFGEPPGRSSVTVIPSPPRDDSRRFFEDSRLDLIQVQEPHNERKQVAKAPGASQAGPQVRQKAPIVPPGFEPLTQGPAGLVSFVGAVHENAPIVDPAQTYTLHGFTNGNCNLLERIFKRQVELEEKLKSEEKKQTRFIQRLLCLKYFEIQDKLEKMEEKTGQVHEYLNGRIEALQSQNDQRDANISQIVSTSQERKKNLAARAKLLRDQNNERRAKKEKNKSMEKRVLKVLGFGGLLVASVGAAYLLSKK